jgi:hypothetical protein
MVAVDQSRGHIRWSGCLVLVQIRIVVRSDSGKITSSYWGHGKTPVDVEDDIPKFCPPVFCGLLGGIESFSVAKVITCSSLLPSL